MVDLEQRWSAHQGSLVIEGLLEHTRDVSFEEAKLDEKPINNNKEQNQKKNINIKAQYTYQGLKVIYRGRLQSYKPRGTQINNTG